MKLLTEPVPGLLPDTDPCLQCGLCLAACPTYLVRPQEPFSPRGRVALARALASGELPPTPALLRHMDSCLDCLACVAVCPSGVPVPGAVGRARERLREGLPPPLPQHLILRHILPLPTRQQRALGLLWLLPYRPRSLGALPPLPKPLRPSLPREMPPYGQAPLCRVGFFVGCAQDLFFSPACRASIEVLRHNGCQVVTFPSQVCCGKPLSAYGQQEATRELARRNLAAMESAGLDAVVTDCATCGSFLKGYPELFEGEPEWAERAAALAQRVMEVSQFLAAIPLREGRGEVRLRATYHIPCHLGRGLGGGETPYRLLRAVPGVEVTAMAEADSCCGGAGDYVFRHPHLSHHILGRKMASIADTGASLVATSCPACRLHLLYGLKRHGVKAQVVYPQELLLRSYLDQP